MNGYTKSEEKVDDGNISSWEKVVTDAIGNVIEFWGFKRNHGRVWALLYIHERPFCAMEIQKSLGLSKGAVSMIIRELEQWKVLERVRTDSSAWHFIAEKDIPRMIARVVSERETGIIVKMKADLTKAEKQMKLAENIAPEVMNRVMRLQNFADLIEQTLDAFLDSSHLDFLTICKIIDKFKSYLEKEKELKN